MELATRRIEDLRLQRGLTASELARRIGLPKHPFSRKVRIEGSTFSVEELGLIADALEAPPGWPFLEPEMGELLAASMKVLAKLQ